MTLKKNNPIRRENQKPEENIRKDKQEVVDRFLSVLWRREVDLKLTTK